jgi:predicted TIM-barrel fold metal-dependent hydrolase
VKAIIYQRHLYWTEVYPKLGETHLRLAIERDLLYASDFPFVDYGQDIAYMAEIEKGIELNRVVRSDIDSNPPPEVRKKIEDKLA